MDGSSIFHGVGIGFCLLAWVWQNCDGDWVARRGGGMKRGTVPGLEWASGNYGKVFTVVNMILLSFLLLFHRA